MATITKRPQDVSAPTSEVQEQVRELYGRGLYLQAYQESQQAGPLADWSDVDSQVLAGRLCHNLGSSRLGRILHRRAHRQAPDHAEACYFYLLSVMSRRGPWDTWRLMRSTGDLPEGPPQIRADWFSLHAHVLATVRDFEQAERWWARAEELAPERAWIWVERAVIFEIEDRQDEALSACQKALQLRPYYRPAVQMMGYRLVQMNRDEEALQLLEAAVGRLESGDLAAQLASLYIELERYEEARLVFQRVGELLPLIDPLRRRWLSARQADAAYYCGDLAAAAAHARLAKSPFYDRFAERLAGGGQGQRRRLPVSFVKQHHLTCAPATLAALSEYWGRPVDHLQVAEAICYDGTPGHRERRWAEEHGFETREFRVTEEVAKTLIQRGAPFSLTTVDPGSAHLQAVIGFDSVRGTLLVRDPNERHFGEFDLQEMLKHYGSSGPRGMLMVPRDKLDLIDGIEFPEGPLYDSHYGMERALERHDRKAAQQQFEQMQQLNPEHRMTWQARSVLAKYDADLHELLTCIEALLRQHPHDVNLQILKLNLLREVRTRQDRLELLEKLYRQADCDPLLWTEYARELRGDAQQFGEAIAQLRRAIRRRPADGRNYNLLAEIRLKQRRLDQALLLQRLAACLEDTDESHSQAYFAMACCAGRTQEALRFLRDRFRRFGSRSSEPARTLAWAYDQLEQTARALQVLEEARKRRPDDNDFLLDMANMHARCGKHQRSSQLIEQARGKTHPLNWLKTAAVLAMYRSDFKQALGHWRQVLEKDPLDNDAHENVARLLADLHDEQAAIDHLRQCVERFPHSYSMRVRLIDWLRGDAREYESQLRRLREIHDNAQVRRRLAEALIVQERMDEARVEIQHAERLEPESPDLHFLWGRFHQQLGETRQAMAAFRETLKNDVDHNLAIAALMECCDSKNDRLEQLRFVFEQLQQQVIFGDGLLTYRHYAESTLEPAALLQELIQARKARPDLWHVHSAVVQQLVEMERLDDALQVAEHAVQRFPLLPGMLLDLARVRHARKEYDKEIEALQEAMRINPARSDVAQQLAEACRAQGDLEQARKVLQRAVAREPREFRNQVQLADIIWEQGRQQDAIELLKDVVGKEPGFDSAWSRLRSWFAELGQPEGAIEVARQLAESRPDEARSWLVLAECHQAAAQVEPCLEAARQVIQLNPRNVRGYELVAECRIKQEKFDEAVMATRSPAFSDDRPLRLIGAEAEVEAARGNHERAESLMRHVVGQDPDCYWAWFRLAEWHDAQQELQPFLEASQQLVRIAPGQPVSWGYLAHSQQRSGDRQAAKEAYRKAVELAPDYFFASCSLLEMHIEDEELEQAAALLGEVAHLWPPDHSLAEQVRVASLRQDGQRALQLFEQLVQLSEIDEHLLEDALAGLERTGQTAAAEQLLQARVTALGAPPSVGKAWAQMCGHNGHLERCGPILDGRIQEPRLWSAAAAQFLWELNRREAHEVVRAFVAQHQSSLDSDTQTWAAAAYTLYQAGQRQQALQWMKDWKSRPELTPEALLLPMMTMLYSGDLETAVEMNATALQLPPDLMSATHAVCLALHQMMLGEPEDAADARQMIDGIEPEVVTDFAQVLLTLVQVAAPELAARAGQSYSAALARLKQAVQHHAEVLQRDPLLKSIYKQLRVRLAEAYGKKLSAWRIRLVG